MVVLKIKVVIAKIKKYNMNITISKEDHYVSGRYNLPQKGEFIKLRSNGRLLKRKLLKVVYSDYDSIKAKTVYKPVPKSTLKNKSIFSKVKMSIV